MDDNYSIYAKLDNSVKTPEERTKIVNEIVNEAPPEKLTERSLAVLTKYIFDGISKEEKKEKKILTDNHSMWMKVRETSFQGLVSKFENGEDGIYNLIANDKNIIFRPKVSITEKDIAEVPGLKELRDEIEKLEKRLAETPPKSKNRYILGNWLKEMRQQQYILKNNYYQPMYSQNLVKSLSHIDLTEKITFDEKGEPVSNAIINLFDEKHISVLLCNYSKIKEEAWGKFSSDSYYLMEDLDNLIEETLREDHPLLYDLLILKIDGLQNVDIQEELYKKHGIKHSVEYISSLWRNKIPKLLADKAKENYILWYYTNKEYGKWKKCSRCGEIKLAHNRFFSINRTSKDGFYSICKECRNKKK